VSFFSLTSFLANLAVVKIKDKLLRDEDIERVLRRLNRLTQEEAELAIVENMEVVYNLISNITVVMDGAQCSPNYPGCDMLNVRPFRWKRIY